MHRKKPCDEVFIESVMKILGFGTRKIGEGDRERVWDRLNKMGAISLFCFVFFFLGEGNENHMLIHRKSQSTDNKNWKQIYYNQFLFVFAKSN